MGWKAKAIDIKAAFLQGEEINRSVDRSQHVDCLDIALYLASIIKEVSNAFQFVIFMFAVA